MHPTTIITNIDLQYTLGRLFPGIFPLRGFC